MYRAKIFTLFLQSVGEPAGEMTFIDKLNKLEKLKIISGSEERMTR